MPCERIVLRTADHGALAARAAKLLRDGALCVLPTETVYGLAVSPANETALAAARELKGRGTDHPFTWHLAKREDLAALGIADDPRIVRLLDRYWPGPLTVVVPGREGGTIGARVPAHEFTRDVIARAGAPLWLTSVNRTGQAPLCDPDTIEKEFGRSLALLVDDGKSALGTASTVVRCTGSKLEVLREGILSTAEVLRTGAVLIVFVCTGNTCRSPLAEALARQLLGRRLGVPQADLLARGIAFASAGIATLEGMPASDGSIAAAREIGLDLTAHESMPFDDVLARRADRIYCLAKSHLDKLLQAEPSLAAKTALLHPEGVDIVDPFGGELQAYRRARSEIAAAVEARLAEWEPFVAK